VEGISPVPDNVREFNEGYYAEDGRNYGFITSKFLSAYIREFINELNMKLRPRTV
jgi:hypothetical protein